MLLIGAVIVLLPLIVIFLTFFAPSGSGLQFLPNRRWSLANYQEAWRRGKFLLAFVNSTLVAIG